MGNPEYGCDLHPIDLDAFANACGGQGYRIEDADTCGEVLDRALRELGPTPIEAVVDPHEPQMPPKVAARQAAMFAKSLASGTPHAGKIGATVLAGRARELV